MSTCLLIIAALLIQFSAIQVSAQNIVKCGAQDLVSSPKFTVISDAWNATSDGVQCISVTSDATAFNVTWEWPSDKTQTHSFPHVKFLSKSLPIPLSTVTKLGLQASWQYSVPPDANMICNVALDMFADTDPKAAQNETMAQYEIMVWYGIFGGPWPLGYASGAKVTKSIGDVEFSLYVGTNTRGHQTLSWLPATNIQSIDMDISPLLQALSSVITSNNVLLGLVQFGSEAFYAASNVTLQVSGYSMDLQPSATSTFAPSPSSTAHKNASQSVNPHYKAYIWITLAAAFLLASI